MTRSSGWASRFRGAISCLVFAAGAVQAADVSSFTAAKGRVYLQESVEAPFAQQQPVVFRATVEGNIGAITGATVQPPSAFTGALEIDPNDSGTRLELNMPFPDLNTMGFIFGNGDYRFTFDTDDGDFNFAIVTLNSTTFPTAIPQVSNYAATQSADAEADLTLNWNALGDATGWGLVVTGSEGEVFAETGTGTSVTIPMGTLTSDSSYVARLRFFKEFDREEQAIPGAVGTAELFNETEFTILTGEGGGGGEDTDPPFLFTTTPVNGATGVPIDTTVTLNFNEPMAPMQSIEWSANVNAGGFSYNWINGGRTLVASYGTTFPANSTITWKLNPTASNPANFRDVAGNELFSGVFQGTFNTSSTTGGTNDPCNPNGGDDGRGFGSLSKSLFFEQTGNNPPIADTEMAAAFQASYRGASNQTVTGVSVSGPAGNKNLQNAAVLFFLSEPYSSAAALEAAVPPGNYTITANGAGSATLGLGNVTQIPVPRINNLVELGAMNVSNNFTLNFAAFTGAGANDSIFLSVFEDDGPGEFFAPDPCKNIELPVTATSIVIPANTFQVGKKYSGSISFSRGSFDTNAIPNTSVSSSAMVTTQFGFTTSGGNPQPTAPRWTSGRKNANGSVSFTVTADPGARLIIESTTSFSGWTPVATNTAAAGTFEFVVNPPLAQLQMFRAKVQ